MLIDLFTRIKLPFLRDRELYRSFYHILGFYPRHIYPYKVAVLHKSMAIKMEGKRINNERLEFLGDAILGAVVGHIVFSQFPKKPEGFLTNARSNIVRRQSLNKLAQDMGLDKLIVTNFKQQTHNSYVNGNAFEALVGAIYLDRGYGHCVRFVKKKIMDQLVNIEKVASEVNHKSKLIEWGQKNRVDIDFIVEESKGNDSSPIFISHVVVSGVRCGTGKGYSKKESQKLASMEALEKLRSNKALRDSVMKPKVKEEAPLIAAKKEAEVEVETEEGSDEGMAIDFSDITMKEKTREQIIAEAEQKAYTE